MNQILPPFVEDAEGCTALRWEKWREHFDAYLLWKNVEDHEEKFRTLMLFGGPDVRKIVGKIIVDDEHVINNRYREALELLDAYFVPRVSRAYERQKFRQMVPCDKEKLDTFVVKLRKQAVHCDYGDQMESIIVDQIIATTANAELRKKCLEKDRSLEEVLGIGRTLESVAMQLTMWDQGTNKSKAETVHIEETTSGNAVLAVNSAKKYQRNPRCFRCDGRHLSSDPACPAKNQKCKSCNQTGHFARCCFLRRKKVDSPHPPAEPEKKKRMIRQVENVTTVQRDNEDKDSDIFNLFHLGSKRTVRVEVGGVPLPFVIDTGADEDILSENDWQTLKQIGFTAYSVRKGSTKVFKAYGSSNPLIVLGEVDTDVKINDRNIDTTFYVILGGKCSLLSGSTAVTLGLVKFLNTVDNNSFPCLKGKN